MLKHETFSNEVVCIYRWQAKNLFKKFQNNNKNKCVNITLQNKSVELVSLYQERHPFCGYFYKISENEDAYTTEYFHLIIFNFTVL